MSGDSLKLRTARSVKWNAIDRLASQVLYAITGLVLANLLSPKDFGLVGAILIFQAFASLLVNSGFSYALLQRKAPTRLDYSSVLWFNLGMAAVVYVVLWLCAPLIALCFDNDQRLVPMSRVMFITFILSASSIVQVNRHIKQMDVRPVAIANAVSLAVAGVVGIWLALAGYGAWALVWQSIVNTGLNSAILWCTGRWLPVVRCSWRVLKGFFSVGGSMMFTSTLNTIFNNIYSFFIGNRVGLAPLGYYTQGDKWSKMGVMSLQQTMSSSFLPALSDAQDDPVRFRRLCSKMNRTTAYLVFPLMVGLIVVAAPLFHLLFGNKWDLSVPIFQLLLARGIFQIITNNYNNYILALAKSKLIMTLEVVRDGSALAALLATLPFLSLSVADDMLLGVRILLYGQLAVAVLAWGVTMVCVCRVTGASVKSYLMDMAPYVALTALVTPLLVGCLYIDMHPIFVIALQILLGLSLYMGLNYALKSRVQADVIAFVTGKMKK